MKKRAKLNNKNSKFVKSLSVAALAGLTFFGAQANAQEVIEGHFIDSPTAPANGAAINNPYNETIDNIDASFKNNYAKSIIHNEAEQAIGGTIANGGAIYNIGTVNGGTITEISGNYVEGYSGAQGGAIWNVSNTFKLDEVGDITDNHAIAVVAPAYGGAIYNTAAADFGTLNGAIKNNYVLSGKLDENGKVISGTGSIVYGGAIYNTAGGFTGGNVTEISGNYAESGSAPAYGGAIYNTSNAFKLDEIGDITDNHAIAAVAPAYGGAIYNTAAADFGNLNGAIKNNYVLSGKLDENGKVISGTGSIVYGGAIYNTAGGFTGGKVTEISGNYAESGNAPAYGGAIYNTSNAFKLDEIGDIINNHAYSPYAPTQGGAIYNTGGHLGELNGAIANNYAVSAKYDDNGRIIAGAISEGGAIYNTAGGFTGGVVNGITGNVAEAISTAKGGAIYNTSSTFKLDSIINGITNNHVISYSGADGGAVYNYGGNLGTINGVIQGNYAKAISYDFEGNPASGGYARGGAIYNDNRGTITGGTISAILNNYVEGGNYKGITTFPEASGGAIYNTSSTFKLDAIGDIIGNHAQSYNGYANGGAIYNYGGNLGTINGVIKNNYVATTGTSVTAGTRGGAIYNDNKGTVTGGYISEISNNYAEALANGVLGGAIYNFSPNFKLDGIGDIIGNHAVETKGSYSGMYTKGGAIFNYGGSLGTLNSVIKDNYIIGSNAYGGAIYNDGNGTVTGGYISQISGNYARGYLYAEGGAIYNGSSNFKLDGIGDIMDNHVIGEHEADGGAIYNYGGNLGIINGVIKNNYSLGLSENNSYSLARGGAIYNTSGGFTGGVITEISNNYVEGTNDASGGAIYNTSSTFKLDGIGDIVNNHASNGNPDYYTAVQGGAIYNSGGNLGEINGVIKNNYVLGNSSGQGSYAYGGAIYNANNGIVTGGTITEISGNYIKSYGYAGGGAIYNNSSNFKLDSIGDITNNHIESGNANVGSAASGGAIYNSGGNLGVINGVIKNNYVKNETYQALGGAIYNTSGGFTGGVITEISNNYVEGTNYASGGAIYNTSSTFKLDGIGDIINNHAGAINPDYYTAVQGGAIYNSGGNLGEINGVIKNNYVLGNSGGQQGSYAYGGAIYNANNGIVTGGTIAEISDNYAKGGFASGGAIYNSATFSANIIGDIVNNYIEGKYGTRGGAIYNSGTFGNIVSENISNNYAKYENAGAQGGAIDNEGNGTIASLYVKNLTDNYIMLSDKTYGAYEYGGAIYNAGTINEGFIENVSDNYIDGRQAHGGAIYNTGAFNAAMGNIVNNYAKSTAAPTYGGAIYNSGTMTTLTGDNLSNNYATSETAPVYGGAIYNSGNNAKIDTISYNKIENNYASGKYNAYGGALYNTGTIENLSANSLKNNHVTEENYSTYGSNRGAYGGAIYNTGSVNGGIIGEISGNYVEGTDNAQGGAIYNTGVFNAAIGNIVKNYAKSTAAPTYGGAIYNSGTMTTLTGDNLSNNYATSETAPVYGGAIYNSGNNAKIDTISYNKIENNYASGKDNAYGGAVYNSGTIDGIVNSSFLSNYTEAKDGTAQGGAVWTSKDLDITADNGTSVFKGNYTKTDGEKDDNAIYVASADAKLNLKQLNNGNMYMYDNIRGEDGYNVNISGDSTGTYYMFNDIYNGNVTMANTTINTVNNKIHTYDFKSLSVNGNTDFVADVDMANQTMDRFTASAYGNHSGKLNVKDMNFISGSDKNKIEIYFAQKGLKDYVTTSKKEFLTPLYKYGIHYDNRDDAGYFVFTRGAGSSNPSDGFNPAVLTSPVATQAGAQASMTNTLYYAFEHGDTFMNFSAMDRFAKINSNTYALAERQGALSTDFNSNLNLDYAHQNKGVWTKPYSSFESIHLKNGPKVDVISYGTLIGFDSDIHKLKRGWSNVATAYIGYNGSQVDYSNVDASTNGGLLGLTETFYKGNFWTALTATAGASFAEAHTMYGKDEMTMLMAGIGSKTGYNFEFKEGKFIIQPRLFMSYSFVNTFDYTNSAGVRIDSDPMHTVQINPSVKFIGNIKGGWQPYASVGMVWNLLNETNATADGVKLPEMHTKPYVEYGVGLQRTWADKFSAYGQAMLRHGGRNGVALTFGFRWAIGKGVNDKQKVQKDSKMSGRQEVKRACKTLSHQNETATEGNRKVLKQLSPTQKAHILNTTRTSMNAAVEKI